MLICEVERCQERFEDAGIYVDHLSKFHHFREFKCVICCELFERTAVYKRHLLKEYCRLPNNVSISLSAYQKRNTEPTFRI